MPKAAIVWKTSMWLRCWGLQNTPFWNEKETTFSSSKPSSCGSFSWNSATLMICRAARRCAWLKERVKRGILNAISAQSNCRLHKFWKEGRFPERRSAQEVQSRISSGDSIIVIIEFAEESQEVRSIHLCNHNLRLPRTRFVSAFGRDSDKLSDDIM